MGVIGRRVSGFLTQTPQEDPKNIIQQVVKCQGGSGNLLTF